MRDRSLIIVAVITAAGLALRLLGIDEGYFGDELYTADILFEDSPGGVIDRVRATESTPPLYYLAGWAAGGLGDTLEMGRLPSILFGTLAIPATYALGVRTVGARAGVVAAALVAFAPTAVFYGTEARAYGMLLFFATAALVVLLRAVDRGDLVSWVAFVALATLALYSHYTAAFPLAAGLAWALWRATERRRQTVLAGAVVALLYLPWLPSIVANPLLELGTPLTFESAVRFSARLLPGHPYVTLPELPGWPALIVFGAALIASAAIALARRRGDLWPPSDGATVLLVTGLATPVGLIVYSLLKTDIFQPRYLLAAMPMYALLLAAVLTAPRGRAAWLTSAAAVVAVAVGGIAMAVGDSYRRPPYSQAASFLREEAKPCDGIADVPLFLGVETSRTVLTVNLPADREVADALPVRRADGSYDVVLAKSAWAPVRRGCSLYVVTPRASGRYAVPAPPPGLRVREVRRQRFEGFIPLRVYEYRAAGQPRS